MGAGGGLREDEKKDSGSMKISQGASVVHSLKRHAVTKVCIVRALTAPGESEIHRAEPAPPDHCQRTEGPGLNSLHHTMTRTTLRYRQRGVSRPRKTPHCRVQGLDPSA